MKIPRPLWCWLIVSGCFLFPQTFRRPSDAYEFAYRPLADWYSAVRTGKQPATRVAPTEEARQRAHELCPSFSLSNVGGEELYWLAKLCQGQNAKAQLALEHYLAGNDLEHRGEGRLLLGVLQMRVAKNWEAAWARFQEILREDPLEPRQDRYGEIDPYGQIDAAIDEESTVNPEKALEWSKERYSLMIDRVRAEKPGVTAIFDGFALMAGSDLVHRYYLADETVDAKRVLNLLNAFARSHPNNGAAEDLRWANLEMHPPPRMRVLKTLGRNLSKSSVIQTGRVEVVSFFFLGCAPCVDELSELSELAKRYRGKRLLVAGVTTYEANSYLTPSTRANIEDQLEKERRARAPNLRFVITSETSLADYGVEAYPVVAVVDKTGTLRYIGRSMDFDDDDPLGQLIHKLVKE